MKKLISLLLLAALPGFVQAQDAKKTEGPEKATLSNYRVWVKDGHEEAFKAALTAHAAKYHTGAWKWRVYEVLTGPDGGAYMINEGPNSWTEIEKRGDLGAEHTKDYFSTILPHVEKSTPDAYSTYETGASSVASTAFSANKVLIRHLYYKPGRSAQTLVSLGLWKQVFAKAGVNVAVWRGFYSGDPQFALAARLKKGFNDLDDESINFRKSAEEVLGPGGYDFLLELSSRDIERVVDEIIEFRPELSSK